MIVLIIISAAIAAPFLVNQVGHAAALKDYKDASEELSSADSDLANALQDASLRAAEAVSLRDTTKPDRLNDSALIDSVTTAIDDLDNSIAEITSDEPDSNGANPAEIRESSNAPDGTEELRTATAELQGEVKKVRHQQVDVEDATASLYKSELAVLESLRLKGLEFSAESSERSGDEEQSAFEVALDAISAENIKDDSDIVALVSDVNTTWDAVATSMTPVFDDISGYWCGWFKAVDCITIDLPVTQDSTQEGRLYFDQKVEDCFLGVWSPYPETGQRGGAGFGFCPAGAPDPSSWFRASTPSEIGSDESRDRMFSFGSSGGAFQVYFREN